jgi:small subunit ribosomal protein S21
MPIVHARQGDHVEAIIRRFKRACEKAGILTKLRQSARFKKRSIERKEAAAAAVKRFKKKLEKEAPTPSRGTFGAKSKKKVEKRRR